jgi:hypothetical protein
MFTVTMRAVSGKKRHPYACWYVAIRGETYLYFSRLSVCQCVSQWLANACSRFISTVKHFKYFLVLYVSTDVRNDDLAIF